MKKGIDFFNMLAEDEQQKVKYNVNKCNEEFYFSYILKKEFNNMNNFISGLFIFTTTKEGSEYWFNLIEKYDN